MWIASEAKCRVAQIYSSPPYCCCILVLKPTLKYRRHVCMPEHCPSSCFMSPRVNNPLCERVGEIWKRRARFIGKEHDSFPAPPLILISDRDRQKCPSADPLSVHNADSAQLSCKTSPLRSRNTESSPVHPQQRLSGGVVTADGDISSVQHRSPKQNL